jgi:hypothetical protein
VLAWVAHDAPRVGGVEYVLAERQRVALFSGRPAGPVDPDALVGGVDGLDGRCAVAGYDDDIGELQVAGDALGAYPVFVARREGVVAVSNNAEVLRRLFGTTAIDAGAVASLVGGGWPLAGHPLWADVRRVARGVVLRVGRDGGEQHTQVLPASAIGGWFAGREFDASSAAAALVERVRALAGWPGRPDLVPVTGGRDSRLVLAAALRAEIDFRAVTVGDERAPDVVVAQQLCARAGVAHERLAAPPGGTFDHRGAAERAALLVGGAGTAEAPGGIPRDGVPGPLVLWHSGQGGEIARGIYGAAPRDGVVDHLYRAFVARRPGRPELLSAEGEHRVRADLEDWAAPLLDAGVPAAELPDAFYLLQRMSHWAALGHSVVEWIRDTTSPLWSSHVIPHMLAVPADRRAREAFHVEVLRVLAPELAAVPMADGTAWDAPQSPWAQRRRRALRIASRGAAEARRRVQWLRARRAAAHTAPGALRAPEGAGADPLAALMADLRAWILAAPDHPALSVLDRQRVLELLERPPQTLDFVRHAQVMRLASVLMAVDLAG